MATSNEVISVDSSPDDINEFPSSPHSSTTSTPHSSQPLFSDPPSSQDEPEALDSERRSDSGPTSTSRTLAQSKITSMLGHSKPSAASSASSISKDQLPSWRGSPLNEICFGPSAYPILPPLQSTHSHCVLIIPRLKPGTLPKPFPDAFKDVWDGNHVRMPCSEQSLYPVELGGGEGKKLFPRWDLITEALRKPIANSYDLEEAILSYNSRYSHKWNFQGLHAYFNEVTDDTAAAMFFNTILPKIINLALSLPTVVTHAIPLLKKQQNYSITLSQQQIACLLANAFLCTFPRRNVTHGHSEYANYPSINLNTLFSSNSAHSISSVRANKLQCLFHYFTRVTSKMPEGTVTFTRQVCTDPPQWDKSDATFTRLHVNSTGTIEDSGQGMLQVLLLLILIDY